MSTKQRIVYALGVMAVTALVLWVVLGRCRQEVPVTVPGDEVTVSPSPSATPLLVGTPQPQVPVSTVVPGGLQDGTVQYFGCRNFVRPDTVHPHGWVSNTGVPCQVTPTCAWIRESGPDPSAGCGYGTPYPNPEAFP
jgi:hypothetical protein